MCEIEGTVIYYAEIFIPQQKGSKKTNKQKESLLLLKFYYCNWSYLFRLCSLYPEELSLNSDFTFVNEKFTDLD